jgi:cyanophycinase
MRIPRLTVACLFVVTIAAAQEGKSYRSYVTGDPADAKAKTTFGVAMLGGGGDVDEAYKFLCARSGGGDFLVLRASGSDGYNDYLWKLCKPDSVESIVTLSRDAANDPYVLAQVRHAEAIFFAGGDQSNYIKFWKGTRLNEEINAAIARGVPVGGVSAGLAILGEFSFSAMYTDYTNKERDDSITSTEAMQDPYDPKLTLDRGFIKIPVLRGMITDSHFSERHREGRLIAFLARLSTDKWEQHPVGIGIDEKTAVLVEPGGRARVVGQGAAHILRVDGGAKICLPKSPLTTQKIPYEVHYRGKEFRLRSVPDEPQSNMYVVRGELREEIGVD